MCESYQLMDEISYLKDKIQISANTNTSLKKENAA